LDSTRQALNSEEPFGVGLIVRAPPLHGGNCFIVEALWALSARDEDVSFVEFQLDGSGDHLLCLPDHRHQSIHFGSVPKAVVDHLGHLGAEPVSEVMEIAIEGDLLQLLVSKIKKRHPWGFVNASAFHPDEAVFYDIDPADSVSPTDGVERLDDLQGA
jgi:hypothetical protein